MHQIGQLDTVRPFLTQAQGSFGDEPVPGARLVFEVVPHQFPVVRDQRSGAKNARRFWQAARISGQSLST